MTARDKYVNKLETVAARNDPYVWGGQGQLLRKTPSYVLAKMETTEENFLRVCRFIYRKVTLGFDMKTCRIWDCSGLVTYLLSKLKVIPGDTNAQGLYDMFTRHKPIDSAVPGDLIFKGKDVNHITHVATYVGDNRIIHAKGRDYGVVKELLNRSDYIACGDPFDY